MSTVSIFVGSSGDGFLDLAGETCWRETNCSIGRSLCFPRHWVETSKERTPVNSVCPVVFLVMFVSRVRCESVESHLVRCPPVC